MTNDATNEWLPQDGEANKPWAYIAADGIIAGRWEDVSTQPELEDAFKKVLRAS